ncbi:MAG: 4-hydroxybenzoate octaprenyltransferase [Gammaproteobacteria bacterium]|mgnify:FL=1|jgi:4-hydroxybenzoate polyprenyltransferase|nr:4-hydroxybenzoate octaprenyltransferase [Gammaproteobacteria bacterium]MBT5333040.1 4-hydroxybenzoate octaprenyltransferase [Gammaproteobacteria bacterium]MBT5681630.1 4-hydroxybenzoate octaprenyltransferase [Gammaproteobacteria bacterium]MBT6026290.1 4-hydroxybenzoate octaprenyltransferase [Gammaproteobacteria bacterium]MBT6556821.1 4-hydroxybenzoate octaprenyltransferase [Gammaproteobacteria bacterium]
MNSPTLQDYLQLMRLDKPVGTLLLLWPTLAALCMAAQGLPPLHLVVIFTLGTFIMRSAGCVINDFADRKVDGFVERTKERPLVTGAISSQQALALFFGLIISAGLLLLFLNQTTQLLAFGGLALAIAYPFMKRWTHMPQVVLGAAFSWGIPMAWSAQGLAVPPESILMFCTSLLWIVAYDTLYAMVDRNDDLKVGIKSTAILFGDLDKAMIGALQALTLAGLYLLGQKLGYAHAYYVGLVIILGLFVYQQWLIRDRDRMGAFAAFRNNILVGASLLTFTLTELLLEKYVLAGNL